MNNWRKHQEDRAAPMSTWTIDWFSSGAMFPGWVEYGEQAFLWRGPKTYDPSAGARSCPVVASRRPTHFRRAHV